MLDFHTHILPGMDDGCETVNESVEVLKFMKEKGVSIVMLTPHFYADRENVMTFLERRERSFEMLKMAVVGLEIPRLILGAEVNFTHNISEVNRISELCYEDTKYLLLELPFEKWNELTFAEVQNLCARQGVIPIIAHYDRYLKYGNRMDDMDMFGCPVQLNSDAFDGVFGRRKWLACVRNKIDLVLGSDCHNMTTRGPNIHYAEEIIINKLGGNYAERITSVGCTMLNIGINIH